MSIKDDIEQRRAKRNKQKEHDAAIAEGTKNLAQEFFAPVFDTCVKLEAAYGSDSRLEFTLNKDQCTIGKKDANMWIQMFAENANAISSNEQLPLDINSPGEIPEKKIFEQQDEAVEYLKDFFVELTDN